MTPQQFIAYAKDEFKPGPTLCRLVPKDKLDWKPRENVFTFRELLHHLTSRTGIYGIVTGDWSPEKCWADAYDPKTVTPDIAVKRLGHAVDEIEKLLAGVKQVDWETKVVTLPWGMKGTMEVICHGLIIAHFLNHKMQLFLYLKLIGLPVGTDTLYRGTPPGQGTA